MILNSNEFFPSREATIAVELRTPQSDFPEHTHDFCEIFLVEHGSGIHVINNVPHILRSGTVCFIRATDHHLFESADKLFLTNILYRSPQKFKFLAGIEQLLLGESGDSPNQWQINHDVLLQTKAYIAELSAQVRENSTEAIATSEGRFLQLITLLRRGRFHQEMMGSKDACLDAVIHWLQHNFTGEIDWEQVASTFSLTLRTLHRHMKAQTGMPPQRYLNRLRLIEARRRLAETNAPITDIAFDCGFSDSNHFSTQFHKEFALSPRELRTKSRQASAE